MKRLVYSVLLLLVAVVLCLVEVMGINRVINEYVDRLDNLEDSEVKGNVESCKDLSDDWKEDEKFLNVFLLHDTIDEIGNELNSLKAYAKYDNESEFNATILKLKKQLLSLKESELLVTENIL